MMFGFQGRYRIRGGEMELQNVVQVVEDQLRRAKVLGPEVLSPHGDRPPEAKVKSSRELPLITLSIIAVLLAAGAYVFLRWQLQNQASSVEKKIEGMNTKPAAGGGGSEAPAPAPAPANNGQ
jgi:type VI secretion system protein ImpK